MPSNLTAQELIARVGEGIPSVRPRMTDGEPEWVFPSVVDAELAAGALDALAALLQEREDRIGELQDQLAPARLLAGAVAHRACGSAEHHPSEGLLHGYCVVCLTPFPCETAKSFGAKEAPQ